MCWFSPGESLRARVHSNFLMQPVLYMCVCVLIRAHFYVSKPECMSVCMECMKWERDRERERVCVCKRGGDIFFFFSVCIPGNRSAALLNNETSAYMYVCVCVWAGGGKKNKKQ